MEKLRTIVDDAVAELEGLFSEDQANKVAKVIEAAIVRGVLEGQQRAIDCCIDYYEAKQNTAQNIDAAIRKKNDLLIVNLSSLR